MRAGRSAASMPIGPRCGHAARRERHGGRKWPGMIGSRTVSPSTASLARPDAALSKKLFETLSAQDGDVRSPCDHRRCLTSRRDRCGVPIKTTLCRPAAMFRDDAGADPADTCARSRPGQDVDGPQKSDTGREGGRRGSLVGGPMARRSVVTPLPSSGPPGTKLRIQALGVIAAARRGPAPRPGNAAAPSGPRRRPASAG